GDDGSGDKLAFGIGHVTEAVEIAFNAKVAAGVEMWCNAERVAVTPAELRVARDGNFVGVAQAEFACVGVLRALLLKPAVCVNDGNVQGLAAKDEEIAAAVQVHLDGGPCIDGNGRTVGKDEERCAVERAAGVDCGKIEGCRVHAVERTGECGVVDALAADGGKGGLREDDDFCEERCGNQYDDGERDCDSGGASDDARK